MFVGLDFDFKQFSLFESGYGLVTSEIQWAVHKGGDQVE
jgi:hypothetical protein